MLRYTSKRYQKGNGMKVKHVFQMAIITVVLTWVIYQINQSQKPIPAPENEGEERILRFSGSNNYHTDASLLGRKGFKPELVATSTRSDGNGDATTNGDESSLKEFGEENEKEEMMQNDDVDVGEHAMEQTGDESDDETEDERDRDMITLEEKDITMEEKDGSDANATSVGGGQKTDRPSDVGTEFMQLKNDENTDETPASSLVDERQEVAIDLMVNGGDQKPVDEGQQSSSDIEETPEVSDVKMMESQTKPGVDQKTESDVVEDNQVSFMDALRNDHFPKTMSDKPSVDTVSEDSLGLNTKSLSSEGDSQSSRSSNGEAGSEKQLEEKLGDQGSPEGTKEVKEDGVSERQMDGEKNEAERGESELQQQMEAEKRDDRHQEGSEKATAQENIERENPQQNQLTVTDNSADTSVKNDSTETEMVEKPVGGDSILIGQGTEDVGSTSLLVENPVQQSVQDSKTNLSDAATKPEDTQDSRGQTESTGVEDKVNKDLGDVHRAADTEQQDANNSTTSNVTDELRQVPEEEEEKEGVTNSGSSPGEKVGAMVADN